MKFKMLLMVFSFILLQACFTPKPSPQLIPHQVLAGEDFNTIINLYGISDNDIEVLAKINGLQSSYYIPVGYILSIPKYMISTHSSRPCYHVVVRGNTVSKIAKKYGRSIDDIVRWNHLKNPNQLSVGQNLRVSPPNDRSCL